MHLKSNINSAKLADMNMSVFVCVSMSPGFTHSELGLVPASMTLNRMKEGGGAKENGWLSLRTGVGIWFAD